MSVMAKLRQVSALYPVTSLLDSRKQSINWHKGPPLKLISHLCGLGHVFTSHK